MNLSTRELRTKIGQLEASDTPIFIMKHKKEVFVLLSIAEAERLFEFDDMDMENVLEENQIFREFIASKGINTAHVLRGFRENPNPDRKPRERKKFTLDDIRKQSDLIQESL